MLIEDMQTWYLGYLKTKMTEKSVGSYAIDLKAAAKYFGAKRDARTLTVDDVQAYFDSPALTQKRDGSPRSPITIAKQRRTFSLALRWAFAAEYIRVLPLPAKPPRQVRAKAPEVGTTLTICDENPNATVADLDAAAANMVDAPARDADGAPDLPTFDRAGEVWADEAPAAAPEPKAKRKTPAKAKPVGAKKKASKSKGKQSA